MGIMSSNQYQVAQNLPSAKNLVLDKQWNLQGLNSRIHSIHTNEEDNHVFLCDIANQSIMEFTEWGDFVCECILSDGTNKFTPRDICSISRDTFVVACGYEHKLIFLEKKKIPPYLQIKQIIHTEEEYYSLCEKKQSIFACNWDFRVDSFSKKGNKIKTIKGEECLGPFCPRIRVDTSTGDFWGTKTDSREIFSFNSKGEKLHSVKTGEYISENEFITDFCVSKFGHLYFCNHKGIFSLSPTKILCKFEKMSQDFPTICILRNKILVCLKIDGKYLIKIFQIVY